MDEQETTVCAGRSSEYVEVYTNNTVHLRRLRADDRVTEIKGGDDWGQFRISSAHFDPLAGFKRQRKPLTEEQRAAAASRLEIARAQRGKR